MARLHRLSMVVLFALLSKQLAVSADPPQSAPSPAPVPQTVVGSPPPEAGAPGSTSLSPLPVLSSPPAPPPDLAPGSSPTPSPTNNSRAPSPSSLPADFADSRSDGTGVTKESSGGLSGGQKAGIAIGVIAGVCLVGLGGIVYKKRRQNIERSQYGYTARRELL